MSRVTVKKKKKTLKSVPFVSDLQTLETNQ